MNPIFIISDINTNNIVKNLPESCYIFDSSKENIVEQFLGFRKKYFRINPTSNVDTSEILVVYLRDLKNNYNKSKKELLKLIENRVVQEDVRSIFLLDIWNDFSINITDKIKNEFKRQNQELLEKATNEVFFSILAKDNIESKEVTEVDIYLNINLFIIALSSSYSEIYRYFIVGNDYSINSFGCSVVTRPYDLIQKAIFYLNNSFHLYELLTNKVLTKEEFDNVSSSISNLDSANKTKKLLNSKYSKNSDEIFIITSANKLYDQCELEKLEQKFSNIQTYPFSEFIVNYEDLDIKSIKNRQESFLINTTYRDQSSNEITNAFFQSISDIFREYKNEKILKIQGNLAREKKIKQIAFEKSISSYEDEIIAMNKTDLNKSFGPTTSYEVLANSLSFFAFGSENNELLSNDKNLKEIITKISTKNDRERLEERSSLSNNFINNLKNIKNTISKFDDILEQDVDNKYGYKKFIEERKQLSFKFVNNEVSFFKKDKYSFIQLTTTFSILSSIIIFFLFIYFNTSLQFFWSMIMGFIPILIGFFLIFKKIRAHKKHKKYLNKVILDKNNALHKLIEIHNDFIKEYLSLIKIEYLLDTIKSLQKYCKKRIYELTSFREYIFNHFINSIKKYNAIRLEKTDFEYSLLSKQDIVVAFFRKKNSSYFDSIPSKKIDFFNLFISKSRNNSKIQYTAPQVKPDFFGENNIYSEVVDAFEEHIYNAEYHNKFEKTPVLYLSNKENNNSPELESVKQGRIGNCYFMAAIAAIAHTNPSYIKRIITPTFYKTDNSKESDDFDETFLVRFFDQNRNQRFVSVDNRFWFQKHSLEPLYAQFGKTDLENIEIWPMVIEKAWAKINNGYENIIGESKKKFKNKQKKLDFGITLSGNYINYKVIQEYETPELLINSIEESLEKEIPIVVYSKKEPENNKVIDWHAYSVKNIVDKKINLYNPHGENHLKNISTNFLIANFEQILFFNLEHIDEVLLSPNETLKNIDFIHSIEEEFNDFFGDDFSSSLKKTNIENTFENKEEFEKLIKKINKSSMPLYRKKNIKVNYSLVFTDIENCEIDFLENSNVFCLKLENDNIDLLFLNIINWELKN